MTDAEWRACGDPWAMLEALPGGGGGRKLRLFACACARDVWEALTEECSRRAVLAAERHADGGAAGRELADARAAMRAALRGRRRREVFERAWAETGDAAASEARAYAWAGAWDTAHYALRAKARDAARFAAWSRTPGQARLLRDIFGTPFGPARPGLGPPPPAAISLAQAAYDERLLPSGHLDPARLGVLSDALEEAGCDDAGLLAHLRGPGPHVLGCWAIDSILGKS